MQTLKNCRNAFGDSITPDCEKQIKRFLQEPTADTWDDAAHVIINTHFDTVWNAVIKIDPTFPRTGRSEDYNGKMIKDWERIPSPFQVLQAIRDYA